MDKPKLLIVDDDESIRTQMKWALATDYEVLLAGDGEKAMQIMKREHPAVVTLDLGLPPHPEGTREGLSVLAKIMQYYPSAKVIVVTGNPDRAAALQAISDGAHDFFTKPVNIDELKAILRRAVYVSSLEAEYKALQSEVQKSSGDVIGSNAKMQEMMSTVRKVATTDVPVLITGESGTGKELIAQTIHRKSLRKDKPFIPINCGAIPENLMESELFGHEKGAFTGAHVKRKGRVELAEGGTLFLDEIGDLPLSLQVKLLRFLQDHKIERVGGRETIDVDVRVIAATNKDLSSLISEGHFREDLYYRLAVVHIPLPPLRERREDIPLLAKAFLDKFSTDQGGKKKYSKDALSAMAVFDWPGNVRELENRVRRGITLSEGTVVSPVDLGLEARPQAFALLHDAVETLDLKKAREEVEVAIINKALHMHNWNISKAAEELGLTRPTLYSMMKRFGIHAEGE
ncbi:MAG: atoC [Deltaproteobacteria bacterium]|nr:atoC [Deltaproteobacteria bacterium]